MSDVVVAAASSSAVLFSVPAADSVCASVAAVVSFVLLPHPGAWRQSIPVIIKMPVFFSYFSSPVSVHFLTFYRFNAFMLSRFHLIKCLLMNNTIHPGELFVNVFLLLPGSGIRFCLRVTQHQII